MRMECKDSHWIDVVACAPTFSRISVAGVKVDGTATLGTGSHSTNDYVTFTAPPGGKDARYNVTTIEAPEGSGISIPTVWAVEEAGYGFQAGVTYTGTYTLGNFPGTAYALGLTFTAILSARTLTDPEDMDDIERWTSFHCSLDHGVKEVRAIKLVSYSCLLHNEKFSDDLMILRIKEIPGRVVSNNTTANGAFAVLTLGDNSTPEEDDHRTVHRTEMDGIFTQTLDASHSTLRNLTLEVTDSDGKAMKIGRLNLWFKLLVTRG